MSGSKTFEGKGRDKGRSNRVTERGKEGRGDKGLNRGGRDRRQNEEKGFR